MTNHHDQTEALERELAARLGTPLEQLRAQRAHCPPLEMVRALSGDALPEQMKTELEQHIEQCASCRALAADLHDEELTATTPAEAQRIRARLNAGMEEDGKASSATARSQQKVGRSFWTLLLRFVRDMTREEIARELGITENQVKGALQFAFENLRKALPESAGRENQ